MSSSKLFTAELCCHTHHYFIMNLQAGVFLKSTPALSDTYFAGAIIFITEYNDDGAIGYVVNRSFGRSIHELEEFRHSLPFLLYEGGPVDQEHLFFLHRRPAVIAEGVAVGNDIYSGGHFKQVLNAINNRSLSSNDVKIFVGYCGWDKGELEAEIEEGSWVIETGTAEEVFASRSI